MQTFTTDDYSNGLTARQNGKPRILFAVGPLIALIFILSNPAELTKLYKNAPFCAIFLISMLTGLSILFWFQVLDRRVKLIINKEGVWTRRYGFVGWSDIDAYHFEIRKGKTIEVILWIEPLTIGHSFKLDVSLLDKEMEQIIAAIRQCSRQHQVRFSGIDEYYY